jgi:hypothetical protein
VGQIRATQALADHPDVRAPLEQSMMVRSEIAEAPLEGRNLGKGKAGMVIKANKFDLTADASPTGGSNLEFVTDPLEDIGEVTSVMDNITAMAAQLNGKKGDASIPSEDVTAGGGTPVAGLRIYPFGGDMSFAPQVTGGLRLDQLSQLLDYLNVPAQKGSRTKTSTHQKRTQGAD